MTVQSEKNSISHLAVEGQDTFPYDFLILDENDVNVAIDGVVYLGGYSTTGIGTVSGNVILDDPISAEDNGKTLVILRFTPATQEIDYTSYDAFPAETHELGLDKLTLLVQEALFIQGSTIRIPVSESGFNTVYPVAATRALKYPFFDSEGNLTVSEVEPDPTSLLSLTVAVDSTSMLVVEYTTNGAQHPVIGAGNINQPSGLIQLDEQGKIPLGLSNFVGLKPRGTYRGDDLCPKSGDVGHPTNPGSGVCTEADTRNPSERFPAQTFTGGDYFVLNFLAPEVSGGMNLYTDPANPSLAIVAVSPKDGIIFFDGLDQEGVPIPDLIPGWYLIENLVETGDASFIVYDPTGNTYIKDPASNNVDLALTDLDDQFVIRDAEYLTQKGANKYSINTVNPNSIGATGFYTINGDEPNIPLLSTGSLIHTQITPTLATQLLSYLAGNVVYVRTATNNVWGNWTKLLQLSDLPEKPIGAFEFGYDPNGILAGTWVQLPEGTFLMNTVAGSDASGGDNDTVLTVPNIPIHNHPAGLLAFSGDSLPNHSHEERSGSGGGSSTSISPSTGINLASIIDAGINTAGVSAGTPSGSITGNTDNEGNSESFDNRPLYRGVEIWERTV